LEENKLTPYSKNANELLRELNTDDHSGLSSAEVLVRKGKFGANKLREKKKKTTMQRFLDQFKDAMILILIAAIISIVVVCVEQNWGELFEPALIVLIVILNAVMGVYQEGKAEKALDALKNMSAPHARVIRDGEEKIIDASELVPGDIIRLEAGDFVPADARLLHSAGLKSEESALTGESVPSEKDYQAIVKNGAPLGDRHNMVYSGCSITYGTATAVVTATGMDTEMGKIANLLDNEEEGQTPLQQKLAQLGKYLGIVALAACAIIFVVGLANGIPVLEIFMTAVSLAVSAIPEGLPAIVTIVLSIGVQRMVKKNALIRKLPAVETLGGASVICSDKTGTLIGFKVGENVTGTLEGGQTLAFMVLALSQIVQAFNMRSEHSLFKIGPFKNHKLNWAALASTLLVALVLFTPVKSAFGLVTLPWELYLLGVGLILVPLLAMELSKAFGLVKHHK